MNDSSVPPSTREELENPEPIGGRHHQIVKIATALTARGWPAQEIFNLLRPNYANTGPHPIPNEEIWNVLSAVAAYDLSPKPMGAQGTPRVKLPPSVSPAEAIKNIEQELRGKRHAEAELIARSPVEIPPWESSTMLLFLLKLYEPDELINIVDNYRLGADGKPQPRYGRVRTREYWWDSIHHGEIPGGKAGAWIRMNPLDGRGIKNANVAAHRFTLLEFDSVPLDLQLSFLAKVKLPIAAIIKSGARSLHAWVRLDARDAAAYGQRVTEIYGQLARFGVDVANRNPSRLSRFPGARRAIGAVGDGRQRLLYLSGKPTGGPVL